MNYYFCDLLGTYAFLAFFFVGGGGGGASVGTYAFLAVFSSIESTQQECQMESVHLLYCKLLHRLLVTYLQCQFSLMFRGH